MKKIRAFILLVFMSLYVSGQQKTSLAERLGFPKNSKLLIIHADDAGLSHSVNKATIAAFEKGGITSASIMVPCPWFYEFAEYAKNNKEYDIGVHLTFSGEWKYYKWDGVLPSNEIPGLINEDGYFYSSSIEAAQNGTVDEIKREGKAQIERAIAFGINVTHIDTHVGTMFKSPELIKAYLELGKEFELPVFIFPEILNKLPEDIVPKENIVMVDHRCRVNLKSGLPWTECYKKAIEGAKPGLNMLIVHLALDNEEMQAICIDHPGYGSTWRQKDFNYVTSQEFKSVLKKNNVYPVTWKMIRDLLKNELECQNNKKQ
jgi:predicted glycoside hydrolase/deacetylase ChbG (UPF0249 family)